MTSKKNFNLATIKVVGVGGGGNNAVTRMTTKDRIRGVEFIAINTDAQDLEYSVARRKLHIGKNLTRGLGTGMNPEIGKQAAEENRNEISGLLKGADVVFITAGLGGGTGSGASPVVADIAREEGILTIAVVTKPFAFEGSQRMKIAQEALTKLREKVDTLVVVPNDRIFSIIDKDTPLIKAFEFVDDVLRNAVLAVSDLIVFPGLINIDFADIKAIMKDSGPAIVGIGTASGADRAASAINLAVSSPLLEISMDGAKGILFSVSGGRDLKMSEVNEIAKIIAESMDPNAKVIFGAYQDRRLRENQIKVTVIATGFNNLTSSRLLPSTNASTSLFMPEISSAENRLKTAPPLNNHKEEDPWEEPAFLRRKKK